MKRKRVINERNSRVRRQRDPLPWKYCVLTVICGLLLVSGFFLAARQHFTAIQLGMSNADLRTRLTKLKNENRRLLLSKERASTPAKIAKLATAYGFTDTPQVVLYEAPENQAESKDPSPRADIASLEGPAAGPPITEVVDREVPDIDTPRKSSRKGGISDDQIAALRTKDN